VLKPGLENTVTDTTERTSTPAAIAREKENSK